MRESKKTTSAQRRRFTFFDGTIIAVLIAMAVFFLVRANSAESNKLEIVVKKDSEVIYTMDLEKIDTPQEICIDEEFYVIILAESDGVSVITSECEDKVCVNTGKITKSGQAIVCLPAHISVELKSGSEAQLDGVVG